MSFSLPLLACRNTPHPLQISVLSPPPLLPFPSLGPRLSPCRPHWPRQYKHHLSPRAAGPDFPLAFLRLFFSWSRCRRLLMWPGFHLLGLFVGLAGAGLLAHDPAKKTPSLLLPRPYSPLFRLMDLDLAFLRLFFSWRRCRCSVMLAGRHLHCLFVGLAGAGLLAHDPAKKTPRLLLPWPHFPLFHLMDLDLERTKEEMIGSGENKRRNEKVPLVCSTHTDVNSMQPSRVTDFVALASAGFRIEDLANLSTNTLFNLKPNTRTIINTPLQFGNYGKFISPTDTTTTGAAAATTVGPQALVQQKGAQPNVVAVRTGNIENWGESTMADTSPRTDTSTDPDIDERNHMFEQGQLAAPTASDSSDKSKDKSNHKTLRRLAQNREAARKSRLRKKAYIQNLESSRLKLTQLEQELQQARQQGIFISTSGDQSQSMNGNGALAFDMEYARWLEEHNKHINELRAAINAHAGDNDLRSIVDIIMAHYDEIFRLKGVAVKADVFHVLSGMWKTPAERCFMWLGGFRSSELLKLLAGQLEPLTEQQLAGICNLQQSSQQAEDALSQGMEALQQSLAETLASGSLGPAGSSGNVANYMGHMAMAMGKLGTLENFLRQADNLRLQTLQQMQRILTTRQSARALLAISDYFSRLRALSSLWLARPRE